MKLKQLPVLIGLVLILGSCEFLSNQDDVYVPVRISEIGSAYYQDEIEVIKLPYIELYNYGNEAVDISILTLRCSSSIMGSNELFDGEFELPSYSLQPGAYMLLRAGVEAHEFNFDDYKSYYDKDPKYVPNYDPDVGLRLEEVFSPEEIERNDDAVKGIFYLNRVGYFPYWTNQGFAELITQGQSVDFIRWGSSSIAYPSSGTFDGTSPGSYFGEITFNIDPTLRINHIRSVGRIDENTDTDSGLDWKSYYPATPGGPNDGASS
ncbi:MULTISPECIES: hypothetical protein [unclassified Oceanispirochaeta]|uniref:hypothetical protein n=1 Tax=unclassified Oceanispirochaeta TaxID=2635722 RepID=UPI000E08DEE7|nr:MULTISPECIES: hypothetical protein [unclassified Oceanispirochaeta]MBF9014406.1 hypothetical protein [Oceanispirochaeta sp. M2]NPD71292.1 hypothetical protein [Oceanispirochaeta sp. M1]RDG33673.1 hypothetical protein DV872_04180 [Oceanispirochaeta sp. M1]